MTDDLKALVLSLQARVDTLEGGAPAKPAAKAAPAPAADDDDDDVDLFGSDEEEDDEEKKRITEERLKAYNEKKAKKPKVIAKTSVLFDVKPWDDETDMDVSHEQFCQYLSLLISISRPCSLKSRPSRWRASSGEPASWSLLATGSRSSR